MVFIGTSLKSVIKYFKRKAVSNLDEEKKWTVHYTAPWHQQENVFLPGSRPSCVEDLHRQAKVNLKTALRECDKLRKDGFRSSQYYSQGPTFSGSTNSQHEDEDIEDDEADKKSTASSGEEEKDTCQMRAQSQGEVEGVEVDGQMSGSKAPPLPTPEEKMRQQAQAVLTDIVPINVTAAKGRGGELRPQSMFIPGQYSTLGRVINGNSTLRRSITKDSGCQTENVKIVPPSVRRIRAQKGQGIAAQMAGISTSATNISSVSDGSSPGNSVVVRAPQFGNDIQRFHSLPRGARVSLNAEPLYSSTPFRQEDSTAKSTQQIGKLQVDDTVVHMRNAPRVIALHTTSSPGQSSVAGLPYTKARPLSMVSAVNSESTSSVGTGSHTPDAGTDSSSLYSMDNDGYYTSMHLDSGLRSRSQGSGHGHGIGGRAARHTRTDSLRRKPKKASSPTASIGQSDINNGPVLNESLIATLQQSLQNGLKAKGSSISPSHSPCSDYEEPWMLRSRSQSSISGGSSDSWGYYMEYPRPSGDQTRSPCTSSLSAGQVVEMANGKSLHNCNQANLPHAQEGSDTSVKPKTCTSSPDRVHRLTSPSSGYSSQSNTPTAGTPVPSFMRCMSPSGKPKPRVPERKSSLLSSVSMSSSSTSLSSNTSDSNRNNIPPPPPLPAGPVAIVPYNHPSSPSPVLSSGPVSTIDQKFPPPPPPLPTTHHQQASMSPPYINSSSEFPPPPPPEVLTDPVFLTPPTPSSACLKEIKGALKPVNLERKLVSPHSEELSKIGMPLITPLALQSVQLRPAKRPENNGVSQLARPQSPEKPQKPGDPTVPQGIPCIPPNLRPSSPEKKLSIQDSHVEAKPDCVISHSEETSCFTKGSVDLGEVKATAKVDGLETVLSSPAEMPQNSTPKKKPPLISKKPKFSLTFSSVDYVSDFLSAQNDDKISMTTAEDLDPTPVPEQEEKATEKDGIDISAPPDEIRDISPTNGEAQEFSQTPATITLDADKDTSEAEDEERDDEDVTSSTGSFGSKDDESGEVFESSTLDVTQSPSISSDSCGDMVTPTRPRTTEDLFAAIHRSKRKVLGRKESEEDRSRGPLSPPATPTGMVPGLTSSLPRQTSSIQRSLRKSATSSDTFKALLLKKGSRSETSFRMSAAEMLRSTDPRFQRTRSLDSSFDPASPTGESPCSSPSRNKRTPEDWARNEGMFSTSPSLIGPKYGRSRTPPSAASSKYNARSRILSSPMTVICERDGELTDCEDPCPVPPSNTPLPISQDSNSTLCEQNSS
ncbi:hypothetical protein cypCar_00005638 [Cyprinus carpio]|nr:hypothetical protein cypCar_00005638 [Cyprinus carpio]